MTTQHHRHNTSRRGRWLVLTLAWLLIGAVRSALAQDLIVDTFDSGLGQIDWWNFRNYIYSYTMVWDPTQDANGNPNSGSMYLTVNWPLKSDPNWNNSWNDVQIAFGTPQIDSTNYIAFTVDVKVDVTNSYLALDGSYGAVELIVNNPWQNVNGWIPLAVTNGWQQLVGYFSAVPPGTYSEAVIGFISNGGSALTNTLAVWIDNIIFTAPPTVHTNRPALAVSKAPPPGLTCLCSQAGGTWQRQMIVTANDNYSWNTATAASGTTTYSMTIADAPGTNAPSFASQMFLIPQAGMTGSPIDDSIDWDSADVVDLAVSVNPDGTATGLFQYKVNNAGNWNAAKTVGLTCAAGALGTWSLTFNDNTNVTVTAPDNTKTNFTIAASDAALFADPLYFYVGSQPNNNAYIGLSSTFSRVQISGAAGSINDDFVSGGPPYALNASLWSRNTADPNGVFITAPDAKYWITWTLPDYGFTNLWATDNLQNKLVGNQWVSLPSTATGWLDNGAGQRLAVINQSTLKSAFTYNPTNCYFGLFHQ